MTTQAITEIEKYFTKYSDSDYVDYMTEPISVRGCYYHKEWDWFKIVIFADGEVYQLNSDHDIQGIELKTVYALKKRFESFTGEDIENIPDEI